MIVPWVTLSIYRNGSLLVYKNSRAGCDRSNMVALINRDLQLVSLAMVILRHNIVFISYKDWNKEKEAWNGPFKLDKKFSYF